MSSAIGAAVAPSLDDFAAIAEEAWRELPEQFRAMAGDVELRVADFPDEDVLDDLGIEDAFELTGLYQGVDLTRRTSFDATPQRSMVLLYRRPMLDEWCERGDVAIKELIVHVLVHEIGHHFGLSDEAIEAIEAQA
jgi:predicted Zn-dependent protease with MMP-like domain